MRIRRGAIVAQARTVPGTSNQWGVMAMTLPLRNVQGSSMVVLNAMPDSASLPRNENSNTMMFGSSLETKVPVFSSASIS